VADWATAHGLPLFEPQSINAPDAVDALRRVCADLFFVCDYGQILSKHCLMASRLGGVNLHGSILPRHRGAAPVQWCLLSGDPIAGVTAILMTPKLDAGPALAVRTTDVLADEVAGQLEPRLAMLGVDATLDAIRQLDQWDANSTIGQIQDRSLATRAPRFDKSHGHLDFRLPADYLVRLIRACQPWPGTYADLELSSEKQLRLLVRSARALTQELADSVDLLPADSVVGSVRAVHCNQLGMDWSHDWTTLLAVKTSDGLLLVNRVQPAGKRDMSAAEFIRGHPLESLSHFLLPAQPVVQLVH